MLLLDSYYLERLLDIVEGKYRITDEIKDNVVKQGRRLLKVHRAKQQGRMVGAPRKSEKIR